MMEEFKQLEIYLFPIVMLLAIGMNNWKREERTQGDRIFGFLPFLIICMMGSDVTYHALQLYVHRFTVLYAGYLVYCFFLTAVPYAWLLYVNGKLSARHNRRWTAAVCHGVPQSQQSDPGARHRAKRRAAVHSIPPSASGNHCQSPAASGARGVPDTCCRWNRGDSLEADALGGGAFRRVTCEQKCKSFIFVYNLAAWLCYNNKRHCIRA